MQRCAFHLTLFVQEIGAWPKSRCFKVDPQSLPCGIAKFTAYDFWAMHQPPAQRMLKTSFNWVFLTKYLFQGVQLLLLTMYRSRKLDCILCNQINCNHCCKRASHGLVNDSPTFTLLNSYGLWCGSPPGVNDG